MGIVLLPLVLLGLFVVLRLRGCGARKAMVLALVVFQGVLVVATELLSIGQLVRPIAVVTLWLLFAAGLFVVVVEGRDALAAIMRRDLARLAALSWMERLLLAGIAAVLLITLIIALVAPPNTNDSMTYHLPRIMHWMQDGSIRHFPAHDFRLVEFPPGAEIAIMNTMLLSGGDWFANSVQWMALAGCCAAVSLIARALGGGRRAQIVTPVLAATLPMAILQASSTQNDLVASFFTAAFVLALLRLRATSGWPRDGWAVVCGLSLGLAWHTKGTAYVYTLPFCLWLGCWALRREWWPRLALAAGVALIAVALNMGHYTRNHIGWGHPLQSPGAPPVMLHRHGVDVVFSNVLRNLSNHMGTQSTRWNDAVTGSVTRIHKALGLDVNDPETTHPWITYRLETLQNDEDYAGNPAHLALALMAGGWAIVRWRRPANAPAIVYTACILGGFLFFCATLVWQPWHSRLHLGFFILLAAPLALFLDRADLPRLARLVPMALLVICLPWLLRNSTRPILKGQNIFNTPRYDQMMFKSQHLKESYHRGADFLREGGWRQIGLVVGGGHVEYPLWWLLREDQPEMRFVYIRNWSEPWRARPYRPDVIVVLAYPEREPVLDRLTEPYDVIFQDEAFQVLRLRRGLRRPWNAFSSD